MVFPTHTRSRYHSLILGLQDLLTNTLVEGAGGVLVGDLAAEGAVPGLGAAPSCPPRGLAHCHHVSHQLHDTGRNTASLNTLNIHRHT